MALEDLKVISLNTAFELVFDVLKENKLSTRNESMLEALVLACPQITDGSDSYILKDDLNNFCRNFIQALKENDGSFLYKEKGYKGRLVDIEEFIESKEYMAQKGSVRPVVKYELQAIIERLDNTREVVLTGATGWGKSYLSRALIEYMLYKLSMLHNPQYQYGLAPGSSIVMILQSLSLRLSKKILFDPLLSAFSASPYFTKNFSFNKHVTSELQFPHNIYILPVSGSEMATLGLDVYAGCFLPEQEYVTVNGTLDRLISSKEIKDPKIFNNNNLIPGNKTTTQFTGWKPVVKLTFDNGETLVCTPEQYLLGEGQEYVKAGEAEGKRILFSDMSIMRKEGHVSNHTFETSSQHDFRSLSGTISGILSTWETYITPQKNKIQDNLSVMRARVWNDFLNSFIKKAQHDSFRVSREIWSFKTRRSCSRYQGMGEAKYTKTEKELSRLCSKVSGGNRGSLADDARSHSFKVYRSHRKTKAWRTSNRKMEGVKYRGKEQTSCTGKRAVTYKSYRKSKVYLYQEKRRQYLSSFSFRSNSSLMARSSKYSMGTRECSVPHGDRRRISHIYPRFFTPPFYYRGKVSMEKHAYTTMASYTKYLFSLSYTGYLERNEKDRNAKVLQLYKQEQDKLRKFSRDRSLFNLKRCIRVDNLNVIMPVYDLHDVGGSHFFITHTENGFIPVKNCMSELNYFSVVENSKQLTMRGQEDTTYDQASNAYTNLIQRLKSRFQTYGKIPGCLILDSAVHYPGDFLSKKIEEAKWDKQIYVVKHAIWDTLSADRFSGKKFIVEIGTLDRSSRILESKEFALPEADLLEVPEEYRSDFDRDIETALRDFAGLATGHRRAFMPFKESIIDAYTVYEAYYNNQTLFTEESIVVNDYFVGPWEWDLLINKNYMKQIAFDKNATFSMHVDLGVSKDRVGIAIGHIQEYKSLPSTSFYSKERNDFTEVLDMDAPVICIDGIMQIRPPQGGEVDFDMLRGFMFYLCDLLNIKFVTMDTYQNVSFIQGLRKLKVRSGPLSTVTTPVPYMEAKSAYIEGRIIHPRHEIYIDELLFLEYDPKKQRVDHLPNRHNDTCDAVVGVVHILTHKVASYKRSRKDARVTDKVPAHRQIVINKL